MLKEVSTLKKSVHKVNRIMKKSMSDRLIVFFFLLIPVVLMLLFSYYPAVKLFQLSFSDWDGLSKVINYVNFDNYKEIFSQPELLRVFANNGAYIIILAIQQIMALYIAIVLDSNIRVKNFFKSTIFMPYILNGVAVAFMFSYMYDFQNGPINALLKNLSLDKYAIHFLTEGYSSNFSLAFIGFWKNLGITMVIYLAALQSIPTEIYEASRIDGANFFQNIIYMTIPNIKRMLSINLILGINGCMQAYFEALVITKGGPNGATDTFVTKSLYIAFTDHKFGKASAMGVILLFIVIIIALIQKSLLKEEDYA